MRTHITLVQITHLCGCIKHGGYPCMHTCCLEYITLARSTVYIGVTIHFLMLFMIEIIGRKGCGLAMCVLVHS